MIFATHVFMLDRDLTFLYGRTVYDHSIIIHSFIMPPMFGDPSFGMIVHSRTDGAFRFGGK